MTKIKISAPGKLMLFGEHAVVYGKPCLAGAINQRLFVRVEKIGEKKISLEAPEMKISHFSVSLSNLAKVKKKKVRFIFQAVKIFFQKYKVISGLKIKTESQFLPQYGLGSSSAVTVSIIKALAELFGVKMEKKEIFNLAYKTVLDVQGAGSGFDLACAIWGGVIYFLAGGEKIEPLKVKNIPLIVGYTGKKVQTSEIVKKVKKAMEKNPNYYQALYEKIAEIVEKAKICLLKSDWQKVGELMNENQEILRKFKTPSLKYGLSSPMIEKLIKACLKSGAFGAKLSGAGVGDCIIAIGENKEKIRMAIKKAGGIPLSVKIENEGLKLEKI